jgi:hypothetical protein
MIQLFIQRLALRDVAGVLKLSTRTDYRNQKTLLKTLILEFFATRITSVFGIGIERKLSINLNILELGHGFTCRKTKTEFRR